METEGKTPDVPLLSPSVTKFISHGFVSKEQDLKNMIKI